MTQINTINLTSSTRSRQEDDFVSVLDSVFSSHSNLVLSFVSICENKLLLRVIRLMIDADFLISVNIFKALLKSPESPNVAMAALHCLTDGNSGSVVRLLV